LEKESPGRESKRQAGPSQHLFLAQYFFRDLKMGIRFGCCSPLRHAPQVQNTKNTAETRRSDTVFLGLVCYGATKLTCIPLCGGVERKTEAGRPFDVILVSARECGVQQGSRGPFGAPFHTNYLG
jgi:hypothetical protein